MFVDYSGLERFSVINESFGNKYLQLLRFDAIQSPEDRLKELKENSNGLDSVHAVRLEDFKLDWGIIDFMYKMLLCITQMQEVSSYIRKCPTVYFAEMFDQPCPMSRYSMENLSSSLLKMYRDIQKAYDDIKNELLEEVRTLIAELKPDYGFREFDQWHILQKYLYFECCKGLSKQQIPKTQVVLIPKSFPKLYMEQVNKSGFMKESAQVRFFMFDTLSNERSFDPISRDDLKLKTLGDKVTTIWKEKDDKADIGSDTERTASTQQSNKSSAMGSSPVGSSRMGSSRVGSTAKEPDFIRLFKEHDVNVGIKRPSVRFAERNETIGSKGKDEKLKIREYYQYSNDRDERYTAQMVSPVGKKSPSPISPILEEDESEVDNSSSGRSNENQVFSPLSSGNLPTAVTPDNDSDVSSPQKRLFCYNDDCSPSMFPQPPDLPPSAFKDFYAHQSKREAVKEKFKEYVAKPIQKCFTRNSDSSGFDTVDSFAQFQGAPWDEMTSKKFIKFKLKKFKRDCRYYKQIAKRFFEDIHDTSSSHKL